MGSLVCDPGGWQAGQRQGSMLGGDRGVTSMDLSSVCMPSSGIVELINREDWEEPL